MKRDINTLMILFGTMMFLTIHAEDKPFQRVEDIMSLPKDQFQLAQKEMQVWEKDLFDSLKNQNDPNLKVFAIDKMLFKLSEKSEDTLNQAYKELSEEMINVAETSGVSAQSLMRLAIMCGQQKIKDHCDVQRIYLSQANNTPDNMMIYLQPLQDAISIDSQDEIERLIDSMANSEYINFDVSLPEKYIDFLKTYVARHPFPVSFIESEVEAILLMYGFSEQKLKHIRENPQDYVLMSYMIGYKLAMPIPAFRPLIETCEKKEKLASKCNQIADILIHQSKSYISAALGKKLKSVVAQHLGDESKIKQSEKDFAAIKAQMECLNKVQSTEKFGMDTKFGLAQFEMYSKIEREKGELAALLYNANLVYQELKEKNNEHAIDPNTCLEVKF